MGKVKINVANGSTIEKPIITCFRGAKGDYLVLDNETNGSMGLPIICISKFKGTSVEKIFDQSEWTSVKENLKTIIAGTALPYLNVPESLSAQEDFFTQLTLPVASFDLLKSVYAPVAPQTEAPVVDTPVTEPAPQVVATEPALDILAPTALSTITPTIETPTPAVTPPVAVMPSEPITPAALAPAPSIEPSVQTSALAQTVDIVPPVVPSSTSPVAPVQNLNEIQIIKETFMKSCENMFDALLKKFENK